MGWDGWGATLGILPQPRCAPVVGNRPHPSLPLPTAGSHSDTLYNNPKSKIQLQPPRAHEPAHDEELHQGQGRIMVGG